MHKRLENQNVLGYDSFISYQNVLVFLLYTNISGGIHMKKRFVSILLVAAMTASLAACGGSIGGDNSLSL